MKIWPIDPLQKHFDDDPGFAEALRNLGAGRLVAVPTETVYGLAADATNADAVAGIFAAKERPSFNPLISHVEDLDAAERHGVFDAAARTLAEAFWPGPLTLVVERRSTSPICDLATAGLSTVGLRVPATRVTRALTAALGRPLAAPSANRSGRISTTTAEAVAADLGERIAGIVDCGPTPVGVESTIVATVGPDPVLLRPGGIPRGAIEELLGRPLAAPTDAADRPSAPGMLASHYAPDAKVRLDAEDVRPGEALLAFGPELPPGADGAIAVANLSPAGDLTEAAKALFGLMRRLDASGAATIAVMPIPDDGLGEAIRDRLSRAAAPRNMHRP
ncbi:L-threonylcarbamoyladenylate synthase [Rhodobium gokarnense]|uniref:Threonylcarbamoyl-AMP synthase n=1 Tax=Rhodobium gokarnense TaxID=364296 RepID=A0ABT3HHZ5_9HYPH|nr:L-threonylcarbamoyladenylate synthase [Rhodobium gokarnense]MCW2310023.1 L-threonylcarbamoyladenylate synthase [Rhodobium gokarnense]